MRSNLAYPLEKMSTGIVALACGTNRIQDRLYFALSPCIIIFGYDLGDPGLTHALRDIVPAATKIDEAEAGSLKATTDHMSTDEAAAIAKKFVELFFDVTIAYYDQ